MTDPVEHIARATAAHLTAEHGPTLPVDVEAALHARDSTKDRYLDPVALGALIVSVASLAWTIYTDLKQKTPNPSPDVLARAIRVQIREAAPDSPDRDRIIDIVVSETLDYQ
jgi:hypothetical protein